jgi:hypothetical protein
VSAAESQWLFSAAVLLAAKNKLFSAASHCPPKIKAYFWLIFSGSQEPPKISLKPPKIAYFRWFLAAENDCSCCSVWNVFEREMCPWAISKYFGD